MLSKLVRKVEHQLTERDRFTFKQVQDSYDERTNKLAKLIREAQDERNKLKCKCPQTLESRIRHAKSKLRRDNMKKARLAGREPYLHEEWMKIQRKQDLRDEKERRCDKRERSRSDMATILLYGLGTMMKGNLCTSLVQRDFTRGNQSLATRVLDVYVSV